MKRLALLAVVVLCLGGCLEMFKAPPADDPTTTINETEEHEKKVAEQEDLVRTGGEIGGAVAPLPFKFIPTLITAGILGVAAWMRNKGK